MRAIYTERYGAKCLGFAIARTKSYYEYDDASGADPELIYGGGGVKIVLVHIHRA